MQCLLLIVDHFFDQITIKDIKTAKSVILIVNNSHLISSHLFIDVSTELIIGCVNESKLYMSDSQLIRSKANEITFYHNVDRIFLIRIKILIFILFIFRIFSYFFLP